MDPKRQHRGCWTHPLPQTHWIFPTFRAILLRDNWRPIEQLLHNKWESDCIEKVGNFKSSPGPEGTLQDWRCWWAPLFMFPLHLIPRARALPRSCGQSARPLQCILGNPSPELTLVGLKRHCGVHTLGCAALSTLQPDKRVNRARPSICAQMATPSVACSGRITGHSSVQKLGYIPPELTPPGQLAPQDWYALTLTPNSQSKPPSTQSM